MFHSGTQCLIDAWAALPGAHRIPNRAGLDPSAFTALLPRVFLLERREDGAGVRLAGAWVEALHGRPLKGVRWLDLWSRESRLLIHSSITRTLRDARPVVVVASTADPAEPLEICLCPLRGPTGAADRLIGLYQPTTAAGAEARDIAILSADAAASVEVGFRRPALTLAAIDGRRIA